MRPSVIASPATHPDLSSKSQVNSSTHPWKKAFPVTVSLQVDGNGCLIVMKSFDPSAPQQPIYKLIVLISFNSYDLKSQNIGIFNNIDNRFNDLKYLHFLESFSKQHWILALRRTLSTVS